jgi:hypothetical protein
MLTSKEVFAKRKEGQIAEAYNMALALADNNPHDEWNIKALAYCIIDMLKQAVNINDFTAAQNFAADLNRLNIDKNDEILTRSVHSAMQLADPQKKIITEAKALSKQGKHHDAVNAYRTALKRFPNDIALHESLGWELYRVGKQMFETENIDIYPAKQLLAEYIRLQNERPSLLHSLFLRYADKLIGNEGFNLVAFLKLWDLNNLTEEDYQPYVADNGKTYPSIAERVIQHAAKDALSKKQTDDVAYIFPFIDKAIQKFPDNFWLIYYKAKLLHMIGQNDAALEFSTSVTKTKVNEYWAWDLLAEILLDIDREKAFSCYCKALLCRGEDKFLANVRIKFADLLIQKSLYSEAKYEIDKAIQSRENEGWKITETLMGYQNSDWYPNTTATKNNQNLYKDNTNLAETLLFDSMPWLNAIVGDKFTLPNKPNKPNKPKRKIFIALTGNETPFEMAVPENKYDFKSLSVGEGIKIKGEFNQENRFQIYLIDKRAVAKKWDIFQEQIGVIDHINYEKKIAHFIVDRNINGILRFSDFPIKFTIGDTLALRLSNYENDKGVRYTVLTCRKTDEKPKNNVIKQFSGSVRVSNGLGFTNDDVFIDRSLVENYSIKEDDIVAGTAVLSYNRKRNTWGWKAMIINNI